MDQVEIPSVETEGVAEPQSTEAIQQAPEQQKPESKADYKWAEMRRRQDDLQKELKAQKEMNEKLMLMASSSFQKPQEQPSELDSISDDDFIPAGKVKKLVQREAAAMAKAEAEKMMQQQHQSQFLNRLKSQFNDFDQIVNAETLAKLEVMDPDLASTIAELKDPYKMGLQSYKYIKAMGLKESAPEEKRAKEVDKKIEENAKTVQSPQAFDKRPMAQAFKMSDSEKKQLYSEMIQFANQAGGSF